MYQDFYGLRELPFELTANPRYLYLTSRQREALSVLEYGLFSAKSLTLLVGEAGTGKTTLIRAALESERCRDVQCIYLNNPVLTPADFLATLARRFDLGSDAFVAKSVLLERLDATLRERRARGEITALAVDEAQALSTELLEEIRLLANIETPSEKLLPLVLAGQPELAERLEEHSLRQLKQRVTLRCELVPFDLADTAGYIASRIITAGGVPKSLFTQEAIRTHSRVLEWHPANDQRHLRQRPRQLGWPSGAGKSIAQWSPTCAVICGCVRQPPRRFHQPLSRLKGWHLCRPPDDQSGGGNTAAGGGALATQPIWVSLRSTPVRSSARIFTE